MPDYVWEYAGRVIRRVDVVLGLAIDAIALVVALKSGLEYTTVALLVVSIFGVVLLWGSFAVFQQERRETDRSVELRVLPPHYYPDADPTLKILLHENGRVHAFLCLRYCFVNHLSTDVQIMDCIVVWRTSPRLRRGKAFAQLGFHVLGEQRQGPAFPVRLAAATKSAELEGSFEVTFVPDDPGKLPRRFRFTLEVDVAGAPSVALPIADFDVAKWSKPDEPGMAFFVTPDTLLNQFRIRQIFTGD